MIWNIAFVFTTSLVLGKNLIYPYRNVAAIMMNRMLQGKQPIIYGDGEQKRYGYIGDTPQTFGPFGIL
ncbi:MAG: hypothetical protein R2827_08100 [Bdellovibrionales bacterium]